MKQPHPSAKIGVKSLLGGVGAKFEATKPVSQDWGKVVVGIRSHKPGWNMAER